MENQTLELKQSVLTVREAPLTPEKEQLYRAAFDEVYTKYDALQKENEKMRIRLANLEKIVYGQRSEKTTVVMNDCDGQLSLFNEAEANAETTVKQESVTVAEHQRKKRTREEIMKDLPVEEVVHTSEDKTCDVCGTEMVIVGKKQLHDELVYVPAKMYIRRHFAEVLKCPNCGTDESMDQYSDDATKSVFRCGNAPKQVIPGSYCSAELLAHVLFEKYVQAVPLYRQEKEYAALGAPLSRTTMANWIIQTAVSHAKPVYAIMKKELLAGNVIHADETVVQVLHEEKRKAKTQSRMWVYSAPQAFGKYNTVFEYCMTRNGQHAADFLSGYRGYLVCDGYDGYNKLTGVKRCGCWAHARRKFVEALPPYPTPVNESKAADGVRWCNKIFSLEEAFEKLSPEERYKQRQEQTKPVLDGFFEWLNTIIPGSDKLRKAKQYALNEKEYLYRFLESPDVEPSNNRAENAIRPFVVGRKNWLFSTSADGAEASALFYSLAVTACANGLNVEDYFKRLLSSDQPVMPW